MKPPKPRLEEPGPSVTQEVIVPTQAKAVDRATLTITAGPEAGRVFTLQAANLAGRGASCSVVLDDPEVSREHARIVLINGAFVLTDLGSRNGTFVNGVRVESAALQSGASIRLGGSVRLRFALIDEEEERYARALYESSLRDPLTGAFNRRHFDERLAAEVAYAVRHNTDVALALLDIDHFKRVNDSFGHLGGDQVLRGIVKLVASTIRTEDVLCRCGGEEFGIIARGIPAPGAVAMAERVRRIVEAANHPVQSCVTRVTVSIGVAMLAECSASPAALASLADQRLYDAKDAGRNRVCGPG